MKSFRAPLLLAALLALTLHGADTPDLTMVGRIRDEGFRNSKVMATAQSLTDTLGARLTGSPNAKRANEWTRDKLTEFGLANAHLEPFVFGRGWTSDACSVRMVAPDVEQLYALPKAWSAATNGPTRGKVVKVKIDTKEDADKYKGKLAGAILLIADVKEMKPQEKPYLSRYDEKSLAAEGDYAIPAARDAQRTKDFIHRLERRKLIAQFATDEKVAAIVDIGSGEGGVFRVQQGGTWRDDEPIGPPIVGLAPEQYNRIVRLVDAGTPVELEVDVHARFFDDRTAYNTVAEIPGSDKKGEVVMMGAHLDSWHTATGATDNAAGCAVIMEAARILKALGVTPRRTIRVALWTGEEQGLYGSRAYAAEHFGKLSEVKDPDQLKLPAWARTERGRTLAESKPELAKVSAYFNVDNGSGKIRGIYAQENAAAAPLFEAWFTPLHDLGVTTVTMRNTGSTDHVSFDELGIPGFQFIQDDLEYETRTHHTNWDTYERLQRDDLMQAAVVVASTVWEAANRAEMMPRKPLH
jgi:carboxypeptidase Q